MVLASKAAQLGVVVGPAASAFMAALLGKAFVKRWPRLSEVPN